MIRRHRQWAWRITHRFLGDEQEAADMVQEAFLRVLTAADRYRSTARFRTFFYRVITRLCMDRARKKGSTGPADQTSRIPKDISMSQKMAKFFISTGLFFLVLGCLEELIFPTKMAFNSFYAAFHLLGFTGCLLVFNMVRTLFGAPAKEPSSGTLAAGAAAALILTMGLAVAPLSAMASPAKVGERLSVIMVGDRLVDTAHSLGVLPAAMSVRCSLWPMCDRLKSSVQVLGCPGCLAKKKAEPLFKYGRKHGIKKVFIEKSSQFCAYKKELNLETIGEMAEAKGYEVRYVDFSKGLEQAVTQTAALVNRPENAGPVLAAYKKAMDKTKARIKGRSFVKTVVIIRGTYQAQSGKTFLRIEMPGGYADKFLLDPLGVENLGHRVVPKGKAPSKGHIQVRKLKGLIGASPDAIIMTGDAPAVQKALYLAVKKNPALANVPALRNHALFSLPGYVDASVMEYPDILNQWADFLAR